jgi:hypothetical protein
VTVTNRRDHWGVAISVAIRASSTLTHQVCKAGFDLVRLRHSLIFGIDLKEQLAPRLGCHPARLVLALFAMHLHMRNIMDGR